MIENHAQPVASYDTLRIATPIFCVQGESAVFSMSKRRNDLAAGVLVVALWALLYLPHLRTSPLWYGDEALALKAGLNLVQGVPAHGSFWNTFWNAYAPYQPGYEALIGLAAGIAGGDILGARLINALIALAVALVLCFGGRRIMDAPYALGAALVFLGYEQSVIHFRWIFTHNLVALGFAVAFIWLCAKPARRADWTAGCGLAIGALALPLSVYGCVAAFLLRIKYPRSWIPLFAPYAAVVGASIGFGWLLFRGKGFVWTDLAAMAEFYADASRENGGGFKVFENFFRFYTQDAFHILALGMVLLSFAGRARALAGGALLVSVLLLQNRQNLPVFYYQAVVLLPLLAVCCGAGCQALAGFAARAGFSTPLIKKSLCCAPAAVGVLLCVSMLPQSLSGSLKPRIAFWCTQSIPEVEAAAAWINERTGPDDLVICHQNIAWLLKARTADYLQATTWAGIPTWPFKRPLRRDQFRFAPELAAARFAVVADIDMRWTFAQPGVQEIIAVFEKEKWPVAWSGEHYFVLRNPRFGTANGG